MTKAGVATIILKKIETSAKYDTEKHRIHREKQLNK